MRRSLMGFVAACAALALGACGRDALNSETVTAPLFETTPLLNAEGKPVLDAKGNPLTERRVVSVDVREKRGVPATQTGVEMIDESGSWFTKGLGNPVVIDLGKGAEGAMTMFGSNRYFQVIRKKSGEVSVLAGGTDDFELDEVIANETAGTITFKGLRGRASTVEEVVVKQLATAVAGWQAMTDAEKQWAIARVQELVKLGIEMPKAVAQAAGEIAARFVTPLPMR